MQRARRVLAILEQQAAGYTALNMLSDLLINLEDKRQGIERLEAQLQNLDNAASSETISSDEIPVVVEHGLVVKPKGKGEILKLSEFKKGRIIVAKAITTFFTVRLTDVVTIMWKVCQNLDPKCQRIVITPGEIDNAYFKLEYRSEQFTVVAERDWDSGMRIMLTTEKLPQLVVTLTVKARTDIAKTIIDTFKGQSGTQAIKILREW